MPRLSGLEQQVYNEYKRTRLGFEEADAKLHAMAR